MERDQETESRSPWPATRKTHWFGSHLDRDDIEDDQAGYGICHPDAIEALRTEWQVTIIDPEWGRNDMLWPVLKSFAAQQA